MTRRWLQWWTPVLMAAVLTSPGLAQSVVTDPGRGREIAESLCSTCHIVDASPGNVISSIETWVDALGQKRRGG